MIITIAIIIASAALLLTFWNFIRDFLNGPIRSFLEKTFGSKASEWFGQFLCFLDSKISSTKRTVKNLWKKFNDKVIHMGSHFTKNKNGYTKQTSTLLRLDENKGKRIITEEEISWECMPDSIRAEFIRQKTNEADLDEKEVVREQLKKRCKESNIPFEEIELTA